LFVQGARYIFATTDYWGLLAHYIAAGSADAWTTARCSEVQQGQNIISAAFATLDTLDHFIFSSLPAACRISNHAFSTLHHFEGKVEIVDQIDQHPPYTNGKRLSEIATLVWPAYYMENFTRLELNVYLNPYKVSIYTSKKMLTSKPVHKHNTDILSIQY
jgi:hypothetical protein